MNWRENGVSIDEREAQEIIIQQSARPICIVLIGVDCDFKKHVIEDFLEPITRKKFRSAWLVDRVKTHQTTSSAQLDIQPNDVFYVYSYDDDSRDPRMRKQLVATLRRLNVATVIGLFVDCFYERGETLAKRMASSTGMSYATQQICTELHNTPPSQEEFDVLLTVSSK